jgi:VWA domain-containing protein
MARPESRSGSPRVTWLAALRALARDNLAEWKTIHLPDLQFWHRGEARLALVALVGLSLVLLIARSIFHRRPGRNRIVVPAIVADLPKSHGAFVRHAPLVIFLGGLASFVVALADPYSALVGREVSFPGRRIALLVDASSSMTAPFTAQHLNKRSATDSAFFTTVAAAERFVQMRIQGRYRDLIALVEFGNEAYVVTPFTNDYDNILLSISLIGDDVEFATFPDQGTIIAQAIEQSIGLFKAFNFLDASGNLLVVFTDGEDTHAIINGLSLDTIMQSAVDAKIPVYFVRTNYSFGRRKVIPDNLWIPAVEKTGGRFYAASDEESLLRAIREIDQVSTGAIEVRRYSSQRPQFRVFALIAGMCWTAAAALKLGVRRFQKWP